MNLPGGSEKLNRQNGGEKIETSTFRVRKFMDFYTPNIPGSNVSANS